MAYGVGYCYWNERITDVATGVLVYSVALAETAEQMAQVGAEGSADIPLVEFGRKLTKFHLVVLDKFCKQL